MPIKRSRMIAVLAVGVLAALILGACRSKGTEPAAGTISQAADALDRLPETVDQGPAATEGEDMRQPELDLPELGIAPEIMNDVWLNSEPLRLADLRGKVVLLEFWTFGCINCRRVIPHIRRWHERYAGEDFIVLTVHYPEFSFEEDVDNVREALVEHEIDYAVAIDNDGLTWRAYSQRYWPTRYLIDKVGHIRYKHIGEGAYDETEAAIRQLMAEEPTP